MSDFPGKTSRRRPTQITVEEERIRWALYYGKITFDQFEQRYKELKKRGLIVRGGQVIK